jgi:hypothetical protein
MKSNKMRIFQRSKPHVSWLLMKEDLMNPDVDGTPHVDPTWVNLEEQDGEYILVNTAIVK